MTLPGRSRTITVEPVEVPEPVRIPQPVPGESLPDTPGPRRPAIEPAEPVEPVPEREPEKIPA
jgi:hypothetical protein